jgi:REP element-mobilizing transposase RayT
MPSPRKYMPHNSVIFATFSLEQGLFLLANSLCIQILKSCMARALELYPIKLCHFVVNGNHVHIFFVVIDPTDATKFIGHFKAEVAHRINIILGRPKATVWCEGYDSPVVLTPVRALLAIAYIYTNPAKDYQVESIDEFPGFSSWEIYTKGENALNCKYLSRDNYRKLNTNEHHYRGYEKEASRLAMIQSKYIDLKLEPDAWLDAFGIKDRVFKLEKRFENKRDQERKKVIGKERLLRERLNTRFESKRSGKKMWCLSESRRIRRSFIEKLKSLISEAKLVFKNWHLADYSRPFPGGLFPPSMPKIIEPISAYG